MLIVLANSGANFIWNSSREREIEIERERKKRERMRFVIVNGNHIMCPAPHSNHQLLLCTQRISHSDREQSTHIRMEDVWAENVKWYDKRLQNDIERERKNEKKNTNQTNEKYFVAAVVFFLASSLMCNSYQVSSLSC